LRAPLLAGQDEKLGVGGQDLADGVLKLAAGLDLALDIFDPILGDVLGVLLSPKFHAATRTIRLI
jgi:hypothetical protein